MRFVHTPNAICATTETGRVSGAILKRPPEWANALWDRLAPQVCDLLSAQPRGVTCADLVTAGYIPHIKLTKAEVSSGYSRVEWADDLIRQLPEGHEGRNSWLMNYGRRIAADRPEVIPAEARPGEGFAAGVPGWKEGDTVRYTGRTGQWYVYGNEYQVGPLGSALKPGGYDTCPGRQVTTEPGHYCAWPLNSLAHKFEWVR